MRCPEGSSGPSGTPSTRCRYLWGRGTRSQAEPHPGWSHSRGVPLTLRTQQVQLFWGPTVPLVWEVRGAPSQDHALPCGLCSPRQVESNCRTCCNLGQGVSVGDRAEETAFSLNLGALAPACHGNEALTLGGLVIWAAAKGPGSEERGPSKPKLCPPCHPHSVQPQGRPPGCTRGPAL